MFYYKKVNLRYITVIAITLAIGAREIYDNKMPFDLVHKRLQVKLELMNILYKCHYIINLISAWNNFF